MIPTKEQAWDLLCEYNEGEFHRLHARIVVTMLIHIILIRIRMRFGLTFCSPIAPIPLNL